MVNTKWLLQDVVLTRIPAQEIANLKAEAEELKNIREKMSSPEFAECIFEKVFNRDVNRLLSMEEMWQNRTKPIPMTHEAVVAEAANIGPAVVNEDQKKWSVAENYVVFADSLKRLASRMLELKANNPEGAAAPVMSFDKDDEDTLDFVAASANLRSHIFGIEIKTKFDIKPEERRVRR